MTFFLDPKAKEPTVARGPDMPPTTFWEGAAAAASTEWRDSNFLFQRERERGREKIARSRQMAERVGIAALNERYRAENPDVTAQPTTVQEFYDAFGEGPAANTAFSAARDLARMQPDRWGDLDLTEEGIDAALTERRKAEDRDEATILAMSPRPALAGFVGATGAMMLDPVNVALTAVTGGGGSILRVMGREALVNMAAEAPSLPARFETAEELGKPEPSIAETMGMAAVGGALLGGVFEGVGRAVQYYRGRQTLPPDVPDPIIAEAGITAAEDAIVAGDDPLKAVADILRGQDLLVLTPNQRVREPLIPEVTPEVTPKVGQGDPVDLPAENADPLSGSAMPEPTAPDPIPPPPLDEPAPFVAATPRPVPPELEGELAAALEDLKRIQKDDTPDRKPLLSWIKRSAGPNAAQVRAAAKKGKTLRTGGTDLRIDPNGRLGQELRSQDITPKTAPGLFKKGGRESLDDLPSDEMEWKFPGIMEATGTPYGDGNYIDADGLMALLIREHGGDVSWLRSRQDVMDAEARVAEAERAIEDAQYPDEVTQYRAMEPVADGFFVQPGGDYEAVAAGFDAWVKARGVTLLPYEREDIIDQLHAYGGEAKLLVERTVTRELHEIDLMELPLGSREDGAGKDQPLSPATADDFAFEGQAGEDGSPFGEPEAAPGNAPERGADQGQLPSPAVEQTQAGSQYLAPGVAPLTSQDRMAPRANARMGGGTRERDSQIGGLFDPNDKVRTDMFSDPAGAKAQRAQEAMIESLRDFIAAYHGSPHAFDKFSTEKIGTGEGSQVFGHGLYFAENEVVAKSYRDTLSQRPVRLIGDRAASENDPSDAAALLMHEYGGDVEKARQHVLDAAGDASTPADHKMVEDVLAALNSNVPTVTERLSDGFLYEVKIKANLEDFLDLDAPVSGQSQKTIGAVSQVLGDAGIFIDDPTGLQVVIALEKKLGREEASSALSAAGLKGNVYFDGGSRLEKYGTRNFVVFNGNDVSIVAINNSPVSRPGPKDADGVKAFASSSQAFGDEPFMVDLMDGRGPISGSAMIRELDDDAEFVEILDQCGKRRTE